MSTTAMLARPRPRAPLMRLSAAVLRLSAAVLRISAPGPRLRVTWPRLRVTSPRLSDPGPRQCGPGPRLPAAARQGGAVAQRPGGPLLATLALAALLGLSACQDPAGRAAPGTPPRAEVAADIAPSPAPASARAADAAARALLRCQAIADGDSHVEVHNDSCPTCAAEAPEQAADADLETFATLAATGSIGPTGIALRAVAQPGVVFPAGSQPGVFFRRSNGSLDNSDATLTLRTYLEGALQEAPEDFTLVPADEVRNWSFKSFAATAPFDAVEVRLGGMPVARFDLHEICADGEA